MAEFETNYYCKGRTYSTKILSAKLAKPSTFFPLTQSQCIVKTQQMNIAGRLPENSRNSYVDPQSKKTVKRQIKRIRLFIEG